MGEGKYYFTVKSSPNNILIYRKSRQAAEYAYMGYVKAGKECEWHGQWDGKKFLENKPPEVKI